MYRNADYLFTEYAEYMYLYYMLIGIIVAALFLVSIAFYILGSIGLYRTAKNRGERSPGLAFVPLARTYLIGKLCGKMQIFKFKIGNMGLCAMLTTIITTVIMYGVLIVLIIVAIMSSASSIDAAMYIFSIAYIALIFLFALVIALRTAMYTVLFSAYFGEYAERDTAIFKAVIAIFIPYAKEIMLFTLKNKQTLPKQNNIVREIL